MEDGDIRVASAKRFAYSYFMHHAHGGIGYIALIIAFIMAIGIGVSAYQILSGRAMYLEATCCGIIAAILGVGAVLMFAAYRYIRGQATYFSYQAVTTNGNLTERDIRNYYLNYAV